MTILALSFDLDDTLWPVWPSIVAAEQALESWLQQNAPQVAARYSIDAVRALREQICQLRPEIAHDFAAQRRAVLHHLLVDEADLDAKIEQAYEVFYAARNRVELYPDVIECLPKLAARYRLLTLSNGTADVERIGLRHWFEACLHARDLGAMKPDPATFAAVGRHLQLPPESILHVGDDPELDVAGAARAGQRTAWINRDGRVWPLTGIRPDIEVRDLHELLQHLC